MKYRLTNTCINHPTTGDLLRPGDVFDAAPEQVTRWTDPAFLARFGFDAVLVPITAAPAAPIVTASAVPSPAESTAGAGESAPAVTADEDGDIVDALADTGEALPELPEGFDELEFVAVKAFATSLGIKVGPRANSVDKLRARVRAHLGAE